MHKLIFATNNPHKLREIKELLNGRFDIISLEEVGIREDIPETADTLEENALQKARFVYERTGLDCFADDTGLEVDALDGAPGVYSARYAGAKASFDDNMDKLLEALEGKENRKAKFRTVISLIFAGNEYLFEGRVDGVILSGKSGSGGFGYDPVFLPDGFDKSFAEMEANQKNAISHRGRSVQKLVKFLDGFAQYN
jgi:XTP/dITP diphosphohydrolase